MPKAGHAGTSGLVKFSGKYFGKKALSKG